MSNKCPNVSSPAWDELVHKIDFQTAYATFMEYGGNIPHLGTKTSNKYTKQIENEFNLVKYSTVAGKVVKRYRGFYREATAKLISDIRDKYTGDLIIRRISPSPGFDGEFGLQIEGHPIPRDLVDYSVPIEQLQADIYKEELLQMYEDANEHILPHDPERRDFFLESEYEQRGQTAKEVLESTYDVSVVKRKDGTLRKIQVQDKNRTEPDKAIGLLTISKDSRYPGYASIGMTSVDAEFQNLGIATNMLRVLMESLPEGNIGMVSQADSRINHTEVPTIIKKLERYFTVERLPNSDILFRKKSARESSTPILDEALTRLEDNLSTPRRYELERQKEALLKVFPHVEEIIEDYRMPLLGTVVNEGRTVKINPNLMEQELAKDTLFHEFGHMFIDMAGGMRNARLIEAREALVGSDVEARVAKRYPDLAGTESFDKEVLAQALGEDTAKVWQDNEKRTRWETALNNILNYLKDLLGLNKNIIRQMSREMLSGEPINTKNYTSKIENAIYEQRSSINPNDPDTIAQAFKELSNAVEFNEENHTYSLEGEELMPVSTLMYGAGYGISQAEENDAIRRGQRLGTLIHKNAEAISNNVSEIVQTESEFIMTEKGQQGLKNTLNELFGDRYTLLNEVIVVDSKSKVAGTADVIAIDSNNNVVMFDFKTKDAAKGGFKYYDSTNFGNSQRTVNTLQLSLYKDIIKRSLGIDVKDLYIVPLVVDINKYNRIMDVTVDRVNSKDGLIKLNYNVMAKDLLRKREIELNRQEILESEDINPDSVEFQNKMLEDKSIDKFQRIYEQAVDTLSQSLASFRTKGHNDNVQRLEETLDKLLATAVDPKRGLTIFAQEAVNRINSVYNLYLTRQEQVKQGKTNVWNSKMLVMWHQMLSDYDMLEDISSLILAEGSNLEKSQTSKYRRVINDAISKKNLLKNLYKEIGSDILAESYYPLITRVEKEIEEHKYKEWKEQNKALVKELSNKEVQEKATAYAKDYIRENIVAIHQQTKLRFEQELLKANEDIGYMARWLDTVLNTNDMVTAGMVKDFVIQSEKARLETVNFRQEMVPLLEELEKFMGYGPTMSVEKLYDFMLEKDSMGNYTGEILKRYYSELVTAENKMMEETKQLPAAERRQKQAEWRKENGISIDWRSYNDAFLERAKELVEEEIMTEEEFQAFSLNTQKSYQHRGRISDVVNPQAADILIKWKKDNILEFRVIDSDKWRNPQFAELEKILENPEDPRTKWYNFIVDTAFKLDQGLPEKSRLYNALPAVSKDLVESIQGGLSIVDALKLQYGKAFTPHIEDVQSGQISASNAPIFFLPTFYTRAAGYDVKTQSYDLATLYFNFFKMATDFRYKNEIIGNMELTKKFIEDREYTMRDAKGNPIKKALDRARTKELTKSGQTSLLAAQVEDFFKMQLYGHKTADMGTFDILGMQIDKNKLIDGLSSFAAVNMLGLNFVQGMANVNLGEIMQITEALAAEYITLKDMHNATAFYMNPRRLGEMLGDVGSRNPVSLIGLLNEKWDVLNEFEGGKFRKNKKYVQLMNTNTLFFTSHMGEHFMQSRLMLAMLGKIEAKNSKGEVIGNMRDMYLVDKGKLTLRDDVDLEQSNWSPERQILFGQKVKRVLARLHGEYSDLGKVALQRYSLGRAAMMFRKFMYPGFDKRYGKLKYNEFLEEHTEGSYRQFGRFFKNVIKDLVTLKFSLAREKFSDLLPREQANVVRTLSEIGFLGAIMVLGSLATTMMGESDDDRERYVASFLAYQFKRTRSELLFFFLPNETMKILVSPAASMSIVQNLIELLTQVVFNPLDRYESGNWKGELKISKKAMKLTPGIKQWYRLRDIEDYVGLFDFQR